MRGAHTTALPGSDAHGRQRHHFMPYRPPSQAVSATAYEDPVCLPHKAVKNPIAVPVFINKLWIFLPSSPTFSLFQSLSLATLTGLHDTAYASVQRSELGSHTELAKQELQEWELFNPTL